MSKKSKTVYNLDDDTVVIKIDAKTNDCCCNPNEKQPTLRKSSKKPNQQQVYQQSTINEAFKLPFRQGSQQVYPVSVTVEQVGKSKRSSVSSESSRGSKLSDNSRYDSLQQGRPEKRASIQPDNYIDDEDEAEYDVSNDYDQNSSSISSKSTNSSKLTKNSLISNPKEQVFAISEERPSFFDGEENILATPIKDLDRTTEVDLSVSNIEIAHYPFKYSSRSPSLLTAPSTPRTSNDSDNINRLPFKTEAQPIMMRASVIDEDAISSSNSESTMSVFDINNYAMPIQPRDHGQHCAIEVSVLEKHKQGCTNKKEIPGKNIDDHVGSYDVVSRVVYRTCGPDKKVIKSAIKNSLKSYRINNPDFFGKDLQETRSRVDIIPILPNYKCVLTADFPKPQKNFGKITGIKKNSIESDSYESEPIANLTTFQPPPEVLSVYIRTDRNEKVPEGFQKMHYRGDSCKLHDPEERTKQILQLQKVIEETSSEAYLSKSPRQFSAPPEAQVLAAATIADNPVPLHATVSPEIVEPIIDSEDDDNTDDGDDSIVSMTENDNLDNDSLDQLPMHKRGNDEIVRVGLFNCFRRNKQKRQREDSIEFVRDLSGKRVTHSNNQPRRHNEEDAGPHKLSAQYKR